MATYRIAVLPGDGIGQEVTPEAVRVLEAVGKGTGSGFEFERGLVGGAAIDATGKPLAAGHARAVPRVARDPVRGGRRAQVGRRAARAAARTRPPGDSQGAGPLREPPSGEVLSHARGRLAAQARGGRGDRPHGHPRADRRPLLRRAAGRRALRRRRRPRDQHDGVHLARGRADRPDRLRRRAQAPAAAHVGRQGERAGGVAALARGRDPRRQGLPGRDARSRPRRQLRDGPGAPAHAVRHDCDREHLR